MRYSLLRDLLPSADRKRVVANLAQLRAQLDAEVPAKDVEDNLLLSTWNIRDLGKVNRRGFGDRLPETYFYIAEILSRFDFVAVQEVNELDEWKKITAILGPDWEWIATDVTDPGLGGNGERLTYLYDTRKVTFRNIAGELVLPASMLISTAVEPEADAGKGKGKSADRDEDVVEVDDTEVGKQFRRTPFTALFQASWFKFEICTVHLYYGASSGGKLKERIAEIRTIAEYFGERAEKSFEDGRSLILLGDFNIVGRDHKTMNALLESGFEVPKALRTVRATNVGEDKYYDQIAFRTRKGDLSYLESTPKGKQRHAGAVPIYQKLFTPGQFNHYKAAAASTSKGRKRKGAELKAYYEEWRTYQLSDHFPLWVRLQVDKSENYLKGLL
jgi:hypothetical protein